MARRNSRLEDKDRAVRLAAVLCSMGKSQLEIARQLQVSQGTVSFLLKKAAEEERYLCMRPQLTGLTATEVSSLKAELYLSEVSEQLRRFCEIHECRFPKLHVFHSSDELRTGMISTDTGKILPQNEWKQASTIMWDSAVIEWGGRVAECVCSLLNEARLCGITWGRQCRSVIDGMRPEHFRQRGSSPLEAIPLWCPRLTQAPEVDDTVFANQAELSSNQLTIDLQEKFDSFFASASQANHSRSASSKRFLPGFDFIPFTDRFPFQISRDDAFLPDSDEWLEELNFIQAVKELYQCAPAYMEIFGTGHGDGLVDQVDGIIASVGAKGTSRSLGRQNTEYGGIPASFFKDLILGDIGGLVVPDPKYTKQSVPQWRDEISTDAMHVRQIERVMSRWMGPKEEHFRKCAARERPGVIILAVGYEKAEVVLECIKRNLINHLVIDESLIDALSSLIAERFKNVE